MSITICFSNTRRRKEAACQRREWVHKIWFDFWHNMKKMVACLHQGIYFWFIYILFGKYKLAPGCARPTQQTEDDVIQKTKQRHHLLIFHKQEKERGWHIWQPTSTSLVTQIAQTEVWLVGEFEDNKSLSLFTLGKVHSVVRKWRKKKVNATSHLRQKQTSFMQHTK